MTHVRQRLSGVSAALRMGTVALVTVAFATTGIAAAQADSDPVKDRGTINVRTATELERALANVNPGQTIHIKKGTYVGNFVTQRAGTAKQPIQLKGTKGVVLVNSGTGGTAPACPTPTEDWNSGYGLWLANAPYWELSDFTIQDSKKGIVIDSSPHVTVDSVTVKRIEEEGVHFRDSSYDGIIRNSTISHTGLVKPGYGEAVYIGSAKSNWKCYGNVDGMDRSDNVKVLNNHLGPFIAAEHVDIKEGTVNGVIRGNTFDGQGLTGENSADSWIDAKGNGYLIQGNTGTFTAPGVFANGYEIHTQVAGWGCGNVFRNNKSDLGGAGSYAIFDGSKGCSEPNIVHTSNTVKNALVGLTNLTAIP